MSPGRRLRAETRPSVPGAFGSWKFQYPFVAAPAFPAPLAEAPALASLRAGERFISRRRRASKGDARSALRWAQNRSTRWTKGSPFICGDGRGPFAGRSEDDDYHYYQTAIEDLPPRLA